MECMVHKNMSKKIHVHYIVNAEIPNPRANSVQIIHTCEALGREIPLTLVTRKSVKTDSEIAYQYGTETTFAHRRIWCLDIPHSPFRYFVRNATFFLSVNRYLFWEIIKSFWTHTKIVVYVRGETSIALIPIFHFVPVFFETHQIRNHAWIYRYVLKHIKGIIVITERLRAKFIEEYHLPPKKILMVRDSVDLEKFANAKRNTSLWRRYGIDSYKKVVLYSGTLSDEKGVYTLAESATKLGEDIQVVFLGGVEAQVKLFKEKYGHIQNISILGSVPYILVPEFVVSADVLVLPDSARYIYSNLYTSPMKLFEYMASGVPIVASDVPSLREVLDETSAYLFVADDPHSLRDRVVNALSCQSASQEKARTAKELVKEFTWEKRARAIAQHIEDLVS